MDRPMNLGFMGDTGVGKTRLLGTLFESKYIPPERVLYFDNHGSTAAFDFPTWSVKEPWGVRYTDPEDPEELHRRLLELRNNYFSKGKYPYDAIGVDDWSTHAQDDIEDRMEGEEQSKVMRLWGKHGEVMRTGARIVHPAVSHAHHLGVFQAGRYPDPMEKRPQNFNDKGLPVFTQDTRETRIRPFLQGNFGTWFPFKLDAVFYQEMEVKAGTYKFKLQLAPTKDVWIKNRWLDKWVEDRARSKFMDNPTFDKLWEMIQGFAPNEEKPEDGNSD